MTDLDPHAACDNAGKQVACDRCGRNYVCSPRDDYYCTPEGDHACEACLLADMGATQIVVVTPPTQSPERPYRYIGGPLAGQTTTMPRAMRPGHCMPREDGGSTWAAADAWTGEERYAPDGTDPDGTVVMVWRHARPDEIAAAIAEREERYADKYAGGED